jgi:hypothetical protein
MATPTNPTGTSICTEALKKAGYNDPATNYTSLLTRTEDEFLEEIKDDIWNTAEFNGNTRLKTLQTIAVQISVDNQSEYSAPSDFDEEQEIEILDGTHTGTAQAGANTTITLESGEDMSQADAEGAYILITGGTGVNGLKQIIFYDTSTEIVTVESAWDTNPDNTSTYLIVQTFNKLKESNIVEMVASRTSPARPTMFYKVNEGLTTKFIFNTPCDKATYGIRTRYYANIHEIDLVEGATLISKIFKNWRSVLTQGVYMKILEDKSDSDHAVAESKYERLKDNLIRREISYGGEDTRMTVA